MGLGIIIGGISLYRSYALYEEEKEYNVLKGQIPDFGYDVKVAIEVDGTKKDKVPDRKADNNDNYYGVQVTCNNNTQGEWDYNAWNLKIDAITSDSKCNIAFASNLSKEEYQKYIEQGVATRRNTYRGKDLTDFFNNQKDEFYKQIKEGIFEDIYVGDYIKTNTAGKNITWLVADIDNYLGIVNSHHLTIIPAAPLNEASMNDEAMTTGGYAESKMVTTTLPQVLSTYIEPVFNEHVLEYSTPLIKEVDPNKINRFGVVTFDSASETVKGSGGSASSTVRYNRKLDLMSEINVYGSIVGSSGIYDTGIDKTQYAIFQLNPKLITGYIDSNGSYQLITKGMWLKDVVSSRSFAVAGSMATNQIANVVQSIRPRFLIG